MKINKIGFLLVSIFTILVTSLDAQTQSQSEQSEIGENENKIQPLKQSVVETKKTSEIVKDISKNAVKKTKKTSENVKDLSKNAVDKTKKASEIVKDFSKNSVDKTKKWKSKIFKITKLKQGKNEKWKNFIKDFFNNKDSKKTTIWKNKI